MNYSNALDYIHSHKRLPGIPTLARMQKLMEMLGNPQKQLKFIHVAGTNGKGSTCAMIASILKESGYHTGLTVSPFILDFRERMQINGVMISEEVLTSLTQEIQPIVDNIGDLTEFELVTAITFLWFVREKCELVVAEVGLGGRYDATNIIDAPLISVITKLGLDHTEILGDTIEKIAAEKAAIIKSGCKITVTVPQTINAMKVLSQRCKETNCLLKYPTPGSEKILSMSLDGTDVLYQECKIHIPLLGRHQVENMLTAFTVCKELMKLYHRITPQTIMDGIAKTRFPARMEIMSHQPLIIIDGAHNPDGAGVLSEALKLAGNVPLVGIIGMVTDKDSESALAILAPHFRELICTTPQTPRALSADELAHRARFLCPAVLICNDVNKACKLGIEEAKRFDAALIICGSLYLASPARKYFTENLI